MNKEIPKKSKERVRCANCGMVYDITNLVQKCPKCGSNAYDLLKGSYVIQYRK